MWSEPLNAPLSQTIACLVVSFQKVIKWLQDWQLWVLLGSLSVCVGNLSIILAANKICIQALLARGSGAHGAGR